MSDGSPLRAAPHPPPGPPAWAVVFEAPVPYPQGVVWQERIHAARVQGIVPDIFLLLQHAPVVTLGRRGRANHVLWSREALAARGIELHTAGRGGDVTYHGPGQWVLYPILRLGSGEADAHGYLFNLEETAIRTAGEFGVSAIRRPGMAGAWTAHGKIAAIGFFLRRWVTLHGMSFNVAPDLSGFSAIVPCGLAGEPVTSLAAILGDRCPSFRDVGEALLRHAAAVMRRTLVFQSVSQAAPEPLRGLLATDPRAPMPRLGEAEGGGSGDTPAQRRNRSKVVKRVEAAG